MISAPSVSEAPPPALAEVGACPACPHPLADHDAISLRFCRATEDHRADATTTRGCVCPT
jgi:hypothetical protein